MNLVWNLGYAGQHKVALAESDGQQDTRCMQYACLGRAYHIGMLHMRADDRLVKGIQLCSAAALMAQHLHRNSRAPPAPCTQC